MLVLETLLGRKPTKRIDLAELERALVERGVGVDLCAALTRLGYPMSEKALRRRQGRARSNEARAALAEAIRCWPEPWAPEWASSIRKGGLLGGLDGAAATTMVADVRRLIDHLDQLGTKGTSRTELAASLFGSAHALDRGTPLASAVTRMLRHRVGEAAERDQWEKAGIARDRVSAPALAWSIPTTTGSLLDQQIRAAAAGELPVHISLFALQRYPVTVRQGTPVLVVENPRLVEAAAERALPGCVIASNGNPSAAVTTLLAQLLQSGASVRYHGDFDTAGIAICRRMREFGCTPWMMDARAYEHAIDLAARRHVRLERDAKDCGPTPWDSALQAVYEERRLMVHEEFVLEDVLGRFSRSH